MGNLSCPVYKKMFDYSNHYNKIYHKDEVNNDIIKAIDEKHYPFFIKSLYITIGLSLILFFTFIITGIIYCYIFNVCDSKGNYVGFEELYIDIPVSFLLLLLGCILFFREFIKIISTLKIRFGRYNIMLMKVSDKIQKIESKIETENSIEVYYNYYLLFNNIKIECTDIMFYKACINDNCALLISGKHIIGVTCL